jgi:hypothetical protein
MKNRQESLIPLDKFKVFKKKKIKNISPSIYKPEFIPYYLLIREKFELTCNETILYGFIKFYLSGNEIQKGFYFKNDQLGKIIGIESISNISKILKKLSDKGLLELMYIKNDDGSTKRLIKLLDGGVVASDKGGVVASDNGGCCQRQPNNNIKDNYIYINNIYRHFLEKFEKSDKQYCLTTDRKNKINARLKEFSEENIKLAINNASEDDFYSGNNKTGWKADLDYIVRSFAITEKLINLIPTKSGQNARMPKFVSAPSQNESD